MVAPDLRDLVSYAPGNFASATDQQAAIWDAATSRLLPRYVRRQFHVQNYGAVCDGVTDDSVAVQAAITAAASAKGVVRFPAGTTVCEFNVASGIAIAGEGMNVTALTPPAGSVRAGVVMMPTGHIADFEMADLTISANGNSAQHGIYLYAVGSGGSDSGLWRSYFHRVRVSGFTDGDSIWLRGGGIDNLGPHQFLVFDHCFVAHAGIGRALRMSGQCGQILFLGGEYDGPGSSFPSATHNIRIEREVNTDGTNKSDRMGYSIQFVNVTSQANALAAYVDRAFPVIFDGCYFESLYRHIRVTASASMVLVRGCMHVSPTDGASGGYAIKAEAGCNVFSEGNTFYGTVDNAHVVQSTGRIISRGDNQVSGTPATSGFTPSVSQSAGTLTLGFATHALVTGAGTVTTISAKVFPGETVTLTASGASFKLATGGNVDLGGLETPLVVANGTNVILTVTEASGTRTWRVVGESQPVPAGIGCIPKSGWYYTTAGQNGTLADTGNARAHYSPFHLATASTLYRIGIGVTGVGEAARSVVDGVTTSASPNISSATAAFVSTDVGRKVTGTGIPTNTYILSVTDASNVVLTANATASGTGVSLTFSGSLVRLGIYGSDGTGTPANLVLDAGTIDGTSATNQEITLLTPLPLGAGRYWLCAVPQGSPTTRPTLRTVASVFNDANGSESLATACGANPITGMATSAGTVLGALPDPATAPNNGVNGAYRVVLRFGS